jgi:hypothetical protein
MTKLRIAHLVIQPVLVHDDGEELTPGPQLEPGSVTISQLEDYVAKLRDFISEQNGPQAPDA